MEVRLGWWGHQRRVHQPTQKGTCSMILCIVFCRPNLLNFISKEGDFKPISECMNWLRQKVELKNCWYHVIMVTFSLKLLGRLFSTHGPPGPRYCLKRLHYSAGLLMEHTLSVICIIRWSISTSLHKSSALSVLLSLWIPLSLLSMISVLRLVSRCF